MSAVVTELLTSRQSSLRVIRVDGKNAHSCKLRPGCPARPTFASILLFTYSGRLTMKRHGRCIPCFHQFIFLVGHPGQPGPTQENKALLASSLPFLPWTGWTGGSPLMRLRASEGGRLGFRDLATELPSTTRSVAGIGVVGPRSPPLHTARRPRPAAVRLSPPQRASVDRSLHFL
jgi:hypothetical protein